MLRRIDGEVTREERSETRRTFDRVEDAGSELLRVGFGLMPRELCRQSERGRGGQ